MTKLLELKVEQAPPIHVQLREVFDWLNEQVEEGTVLPFAQSALARVAIEMKYDDIDNQHRASLIVSKDIPAGTMVMLEIAEALSEQKIQIWKQRVKDIKKLKKQWMERL
jgi:hypothetical protein